jgi:hypothetical protein
VGGVLSRAGQILVATLVTLGVASASANAGTVDCGALTSTQFRQLGASAMATTTGSSRAGAAMDERMRAALGTRAADRLEEQMGRRYAGCAAGDEAGPAMMGTRIAAPAHGWGPAVVIAVILGALLLGALITLVLVRGPRRRRPPGAPNAG